ncbi:Polygalacturonase [Amycolatopsis xylanica]|uniref:Polygalacturonase n=1 Tax=Amycolatopsis xylanica TaxID=589385 RepID=A0A1H3NCD5_9PSEU|nr:glycosyl hydrolase family 28 protein [Amycolatopsis xylanica]SDY86403.1 Polygalacturonase [Amycolatopsis xylanica]
MKPSRCRFALVALAVLGLVGMGTEVASAAPGAVYKVTDYGAKAGDSTNDAPAADKAIAAANRAGGGIVEFPVGTYVMAGTVHLKSDVVINVPSGTTITGSASGYDAPESNPYDKYQDYGHSHFHNAMFYGDNLKNIGFTGGGTIDGGGHLITGNPSSGQADKILSITRCDGLTLSGITLKRGGHFAALINGCTNVVSDKLTIATSGDRDGWNIISTTNVKITNAKIAANDDALVFKSDYALGKKLPNGNVTVNNADLSAVCCNALMFGSETCGDFTGYNFTDITLKGAHKSGIGIVSMDGSKISDVHYKNITIAGSYSPITMKVGTRKRCGNNPGIGSISNITFDNITSTHTGTNFSPTIWGNSASNRVSDVTFTNVNLTVPGGNGTMSTGVPSNSPTDYNPKSIGTRPAYGWYVHFADNIKFVNSSVKFAKNDGRPAVIVNNSSNVSFDHFTAQRGSNSPSDLDFQTASGYCVKDSANTTGGALRIKTADSSTTC